MLKTVEMKLKASEIARIEATINKCDQELRSRFRQMRKDQAQIEKLRAETRAMLAEIKNS